MALTKLMHMKQCGKSNPARHLKNGISYILKGEKTEEGRWVGGNAGSSPQEVYQTMLETKKAFGKTEGRQGYHFVISFKEDISPKKAYQVMEEFCKAYLGDSYDYVFSVHMDSKHIHAHVIFNSVSRIDGLKYHYKQGDWEKYIQKITDQVCMKNGLKKFEYEGGKSSDYGEWMRQKDGRRNWRQIIRNDIDCLIPKVKSVDELCKSLISLGYHVRKGRSKDKGEYLTLTPSGARRGIRSKTLGKGYMLEEISMRIQNGQEKVTADYSVNAPRIKAAYLPSGNRIEKNIFYASPYQYYYVRKHCQNTILYQYQNGRYYHDVKETEEIAKACRYLLRNQIQSAKELQMREEQLERRKVALENARNRCYRMAPGALEKGVLAEYESAIAEKSEEKIVMLEEKYPVKKWQRQEHERTAALKEIKEEHRALLQEEKLLEKIQDRGKKKSKEAVKTCKVIPKTI